MYLLNEFNKYDFLFIKKKKKTIILMIFFLDYICELVL